MALLKWATEVERFPFESIGDSLFLSLAAELKPSRSHLPSHCPRKDFINFDVLEFIISKSLVRDESLSGNSGQVIAPLVKTIKASPISAFPSLVQSPIVTKYCSAFLLGNLFKANAIDFLRFIVDGQGNQESEFSDPVREAWLAPLKFLGRDFLLCFGFERGTMEMMKLIFIILHRSADVNSARFEQELFEIAMGNDISSSSNTELFQWCLAYAKNHEELLNREKIIRTWGRFFKGGIDSFQLVIDNKEFMGLTGDDYYVFIDAAFRQALKRTDPDYLRAILPHFPEHNVFSTIEACIGESYALRIDENTFDYEAKKRFSTCYRIVGDSYPRWVFQGLVPRLNGNVEELAGLLESGDNSLFEYLMNEKQVPFDSALVSEFIVNQFNGDNGHISNISLSARSIIDYLVEHHGFHIDPMPVSGEFHIRFFAYLERLMVTTEASLETFIWLKKRFGSTLFREQIGGSFLDLIAYTADLYYAHAPMKGYPFKKIPSEEFSRPSCSSLIRCPRITLSRARVKWKMSNPQSRRQIDWRLRYGTQ